MSTKIEVGHMNVDAYLKELANHGFEGQIELVREWTSYHSPKLAAAIALLDVEGQVKYVQEILRKNDVWLPEQLNVLPPDNEDPEWSQSRLIAYTLLLNNMARDYTQGHDRVVMTIESDAADPESELYKMTQAAFGHDVPVTPELVVRMLLAAVRDPSEHIYKIFEEQFNCFATIVMESEEHSDENGDPILVYDHNGKFFISMYADRIETTHESGDVYIAIREATEVTQGEEDDDAEV